MISATIRLGEERQKSADVLLQGEGNPLMSALLAQGLEIGAVHNHSFYEELRIFYMHLHGMDSPAELARKFAAALKDSTLLPAIGTARLHYCRNPRPSNDCWNCAKLWATKAMP